MNPKVALCPNPVVQYLQKDPEEFRKSDIIRFIKENGIRMVNFMYPADDNRLKTLNFVINSEEYLESILTYGERVDGSSLFPFIEAGNSDLYVLPRFSTAFVDPFAAVPTLTMLASFFDKDGKPLQSSPEYTLRKACEEFKKTTGMDFYAMGELEYYVIAEDEGLFQARDTPPRSWPTSWSAMPRGGVEAILLVAVVHHGHLHDGGQVASRLDRDGDNGNLDA